MKGTKADPVRTLQDFHEILEHLESCIQPTTLSIHFDHQFRLVVGGDEGIWAYKALWVEANRARLMAQRKPLMPQPDFTLDEIEKAQEITGAN